MYKCIALLLLLLTPISGQTCMPRGWDVPSLRALKAREFTVDGDKKRNALALALTACLADPDPALRDDIAYSALAQWLRADQLQPKTLHALLGQLLPMLRATDVDGFGAPFAALVLSEVARSDRIKPWLSNAERQTLVTAAADYLAGVDDYRGFVDGEGWRHGVAHGADLILQLTLNSEIGRPQLDRLLAAVLQQVAPIGNHFYHFGEPERLARPLLFAATRKLHNAAEMQAWIARLTAPAPLASWNEAFASEAGLAKRHNTMAFLWVAFANASLSEDAAMRALLPPLTDALKTLP